MADIHDLNISVIREFLQANKIYDYQGLLLNKKDDKNLYNIALNLMKDKNTKYDDVPTSVIEWMLAYNALHKNLNIPSYTERQIKNLPQNDLNNLAKSLGLTKNNRDNIINILYFMHKLKFSDLDFEINIDLYTNLLINAEFDTVIELIKSKPSLKYQIPNLFYEILINNKNLVKNRERTLYYKETSNFVRSLIDLKEFDIIEKILTIIIEDDERNYFNLLELFTEKRFLEKYFKFFPNEYNRSFVLSIVQALNNKKVDSYYLISKTLETAIDNKNSKMFSAIRDKLILFRPSDSTGNISVKFYRISFNITIDGKKNLDMLIERGIKLKLLENEDEDEDEEQSEDEEIELEEQIEDEDGVIFDEDNDYEEYDY